MTVSREDMLALADKLDKHAIYYASDYGYNVATDLKAAAAALRAAAELDHRTSGEPVAWLVINLNTGAKFTRFERATATEDAQQKNWNAAIEPLYTASSLPDHQSAASHSQEGIEAPEMCWHTDGLQDRIDVRALAKFLKDHFNRNPHAQLISMSRRDALVLATDVLASQAGSEASSGAVDELTKQAIASISGQNWSDTKLTDGEIACIEMAVMFTLRNFRPAPEQAAQGDVAETALDQSGSSKP